MANPSYQEPLIKSLYNTISRRGISRILIFLSFIFFLSNIYPQDIRNSISGRITEKGTGEPLSDVSIFISGTNCGNVSDKEGKYGIKSVPPGMQRLTFSLIGYESVSVTFELSDTSRVKHNVELSPRIYSTKTVEIRTERGMDRPALMRIFRELLLGKSGFSDSCSILNESKIKVARNYGNIFDFTCDTTLVIINNSLGYKIEGRLNYFQLNTFTNEFQCIFKPEFTDLRAKYPSQSSLWDINRKIAYRGSLRHFLKSLYSNSLDENGFQLYFNPPGKIASSDKLTDLSQILSQASANRKVLRFEGYLIIRYGMDVSALKLHYPSVIIDRDGNTAENSPFETGGSFSAKALSELLPEEYTDIPGKNGPQTAEANLHEEIDALIEKAEKLQPKGYEALRDSIKAMTLKDPSSLVLQLKLAAVLEKSARASAENIYEDIAEKDTAFYEAFFRLGKMKSAEFNEYNGSMKKTTNELDKELWTNTDPEAYYDISRLIKAQAQFDPTYDLSDENLKAFSEAENYLKKAIRIYPGIDDYYFLLACLYEDNGKFNEAIETLGELLRHNNENKDAHLTLGMLHFRNLDFKKSHHEFDLALSMMEAGEKNDFLFNSAKLLLEPVIGQKYASMNEFDFANTVKKFWESEDPMLLTDVNERLLEHYSRMVYANLRFGSGDRIIPGWKTERGEILLRYGFPEKVVRFRPYLEINKNKGLEMKAKTEVWYYNDMFFSFNSPYNNENYQLNSPSAGPVESQLNTDSKLFADNLKKKSFERFSLKFKGEALDCGFRGYQFKDLSDGKAGKTDIYFSMAIPGLDSVGLKLNSYKWGLYCFDSKFNLLNSIKDSIAAYNNENIIRTSGEDNFIIVRSFSETPQTVNVAAEMLRDSDKGAYSSHNRITLSDFRDSKPLMLSDIIITPKIEFGSGRLTAINRNGIWLLPNPKQKFNANDSLHIYYEIYNLSNDILGVNDYEQEIYIAEKTEGSSAIFGKLAGDILSFLSLQDKPAVTSSRLISHNRNHQICFQTTFGTLKSGKYNLTIKVKDKISGQTAENSTDFFVE